MEWKQRVVTQNLGACVCVCVYVCVSVHVRVRVRVRADDPLTTSHTDTLVRAAHRQSVLELAPIN